MRLLLSATVAGRHAAKSQAVHTEDARSQQTLVDHRIAVVYSSKSARLVSRTNYDVPVLGGCPTVLTIHDLASHLIRKQFKVVLFVARVIDYQLMARRATMMSPLRGLFGSRSVRFRGKPEKVVAFTTPQRPAFRPLPPNQAGETTRRLA